MPPSVGTIVPIFVEPQQQQQRSGSTGALPSNNQNQYPSALSPRNNQGGLYDSYATLVPSRFNSAADSFPTATDDNRAPFWSRGREQQPAVASTGTMRPSPTESCRRGLFSPELAAYALHGSKDRTRISITRKEEEEARVWDSFLEKRSMSVDQFLEVNNNNYNRKQDMVRKQDMLWPD